MVSEKLATVGLLKVKVFWFHNFIISVHDVTNIVLSRDSNYIVDVVVRPDFGNSSISIREIITTSTL